MLEQPFFDLIGMVSINLNAKDVFDELHHGAPAPQGKLQAPHLGVLARQNGAHQPLLRPREPRQIGATRLPELQPRISLV